MKNLTEGVEAQLRTQMAQLDLRTQQSINNLDNLTPQIDKLRDGLAMVHDYLATDVGATLRKSSASLHNSQKQAEDLQQLLNILLTGVLDGHSKVAHAHEHALQQVSVRANNDIGALIAVVATAAASTTALQQQIVCHLSPSPPIRDIMTNTPTGTLQPTSRRPSPPSRQPRARNGPPPGRHRDSCQPIRGPNTKTPTSLQHHQRDPRHTGRHGGSSIIRQRVFLDWCIIAQQLVAIHRLPHCFSRHGIVRLAAVCCS